MSENTRQDKRILHRILENKAIAWIVVICILLIGFYKFIEALDGTKNIISSWNSSGKPANQEYIDTVAKVEKKVGDQKEGKVKELSSHESNQHKNDIISTEISSSIYDEEGDGLEGVEIWCNNCLNNKRVLTDSNGDFIIPISIEIKDYNIQVIEIVFKYKDQIKTVSPHYKSIDDFQTPNFKR